MHKRGGMRGLKLVTAAGRVAYTQLNFVGDEIIKTALIARFLAVDSKSGIRQRIWLSRPETTGSV